MNARAAFGGTLARDLRLTRQLLERLPDGSMAWRPHARSFSLGELSTHLARLPHWGAQMLAYDDYDLNHAGSGHAHPCETREAVLALFDRHVAEWTTAFAASSDERLAAPWALRRGADTLEALPRLEAVERYLLHHLIHHRGQLTVYLRLLDVPLPPFYGPTADEQP